MSENSVESSVDDEQEGERRARNDESSGIARHLKALLCCLKREPPAKKIVEYDPDECDYVVEKLVVRRVPLALFAIPADLADRRGSGATDNASRSTSSSAFGRDGRVIDAATRTREIPGKTAYDPAANKSLRFRDERQDSIGRSLNCRAESLACREEILSRFSALHPDLKESEWSLKDPLNFPQSRRSFAEDISEVTSSTRTNVSSRTTSSITVQDDVPTRDDSARHRSANPLFGFESETNDKLRVKRNEAVRDASSGKNRDKFIPGWNRKYVVSPFRVRRGSFDLAKSKGIVGDFGVDGKSLSHIKESLEDKSSEPAEDAKDRDLGSNTAVRWRITIRPQRANATPEHVVSEV